VDVKDIYGKYVVSLRGRVDQSGSMSIDMDIDIGEIYLAVGIWG
jgi:hypothetical protein